MADFNEEVLGREKIEAQWMELIMRNGNKEAPEQFSSPIWNIPDEPPSDCMEIEMPTSSHQLKAITKDGNSILECLMKSTNTKIKIKYPLFEDEQPTISIFGTEPDIYKAKRELVSFMPIDIIFDIDRYYLDTKKIVSIAFNNCLALTGIKKGKRTLRITMRGEESMVQSMYKVYQEIREMQSKFESKQPYLRIIRHAVVLDTTGIFDDLDLDSVIPEKIKEYTTSNASSDNDDYPLPPDANFIKMPTTESYEVVLRDAKEWIVLPKRKPALEEFGNIVNIKAADLAYLANHTTRSSVKLKDILAITKSR